MNKPVTIVDIQEGGTSIQVVKDAGEYFVFNGDQLRHPHCDADAAIRALGHYLNGFVYQHEKQLAAQRQLQKSQDSSSSSDSTELTSA